MDTQSLEKKTKDMMKKTPKVAVVILNWNGKFFLEKFLPSVYNSVYDHIEFVIGDNNSTDNSLDFVRQNYPSLRIIQNHENLGFAEGYNEVLKHVDADYFVLLNSDIEVTPNWIQPVIDYLETDELLVAAQPKILAFHNKQLFEHAGAAGGFIDAYGFPFCRGRMLHEVEADRGQYNESCEIFWASGAALFIKANAWREAKGFDSDFFMHMEEIDLCWRLKKRGYKIGYVSQSVVYHVGGGTLNTENPQKTYYNFRNNLVMLQKNLAFPKSIWIIFLRLWFDFAALLKFMTEGKYRDAWAVSRAHQYFFLNIFKNARKRQQYKGLENQKGIYKRSFIVDFYMNKMHKFSDLDKNNFH